MGESKTSGEMKKTCTSPRFSQNRAVSPRGWPDAMELETLDEDLQRAYGLPLRDVWKETLTLGELFARASSRVA